MRFIAVLTCRTAVACSFIALVTVPIIVFNVDAALAI
jgi:hypothetical protein